MGEELNFDNIIEMGENDNLFADVEEEDETSSEDTETTEESTSTEEDTTEVKPETLFKGSSESVGSDEDDEGQEDAESDSDGSSPNFYSSIAKALKEEGVFPDLEDDVLKQIQHPDDFKYLIEHTIRQGIDSRNNMIYDALTAGVEPTEIKKYENTINYLNAINDDYISDESDKGEKLRKDLIYQDFINRGYTPERAKREVKKSFDAGSDIEDAREALQSNREFFGEQYVDLVEEAKAQAAQIQEYRAQQAATLRDAVLSDGKVLGELDVPRSTRQKAFENIMKPVYRDPKTGTVYTAIQKYEMDNKVDFIKNVGMLFTLTDGFKNMDKLVKGKVRKEVKRGLRELESTLNNTSSFKGDLELVSGVSPDAKSVLDKGWTLDI